MSARISNQNKYYFSDKLNRQLSQISRYPLTVVEAPSGFGKTTAVREYLKNELSKASCIWYTCLGESASTAWISICELFSNLNRQVADDLKDLNPPNIDTLFYIASYLRNIQCEEETYLVIDNYHLLNCSIHRELMNAFSMHECAKLHMIFITQQLKSRQQPFIHNNNIYMIEGPSFFFDREGIAAFFRMEGLRLTEEEIENIFITTEGWVAAIRLQMIHFKETGALVCSAGIENLVETAVWNRLKPTEQDFLLTVSVFDSFTAQQAAAMVDENVIPVEIEEDLRTSDFIRFIPDKRLFIIHSILLDYLRYRFYYHMPKEYQDHILHKAGISCAAEGEYCIAARFFYKVGDFDGLLSLPFTRAYIEKQKEKCQAEFIKAIIGECSEDILCKYPFTMIVFGYYVFLNDYYDTYERLCRLLRKVLKEKRDMTKEEIQKLTGEFIILKAFGEFNDLSKMKGSLGDAWEMLGAHSYMLKESTQWLSVFPTALGMFWREPGGLNQTLKTMDEIRALYRKYSKGKGTGFSHLVWAEAMLLKGDDDEAEILCHKSLYKARSCGQTSISLYAEFNLARIFILRGDTEKFLATVKNIQGYGEKNPELPICKMVDLCMSMISLLLGSKDHVAPWLYSMESIEQSVYAPVVPFARVLYFQLLLADKRYNELCEASLFALDILENSSGNAKYRMPRVYYLIFLAVAVYHNGNTTKALGYLKEAVDMALIDQVYLPFADHECMGDLLLGLNGYSFHEEKALDRTLLPYEKALKSPIGRPLRGEQGSFTDLMTLCKRQAKGISIIKKAFLGDKSLLTPREREIALLAKDRMSAKEIAAKLYISETTVKSTLRSVYGKLEIHSRSELIARKF